MLLRLNKCLNARSFCDGRQSVQQHSITSANPTLDPGGFIHGTQKTKASGNAALPLKFHSPLVKEMAATFCRLCTELKMSLHLSPFKKLVAFLLVNKYIPPSPFQKSRIFIYLIRTALMHFLSPQGFSNAPPFS